MATDGQEYKNLHDRIEAATISIFDFPYPFYDINKKITFETKFLYHFFNKEIAFETVGLWKMYLRNTLNEIMPYYNDLYKTVNIDYNFLNDINLTESYTKTANLQKMTAEITTVQ